MWHLPSNSHFLLLKTSNFIFKKLANRITQKASTPFVTILSFFSVRLHLTGCLLHFFFRSLYIFIYLALIWWSWHTSRWSWHTIWHRWHVCTYLIAHKQSTEILSTKSLVCIRNIDDYFTLYLINVTSYQQNREWIACDW